MNRKIFLLSDTKAASAALAIITLFPFALKATEVREIPISSVIEKQVIETKTIPAFPNPEEAFNRIKTAYHFQEAQTPELIKHFINSFPASTYSAEARFLLANWYFFAKEYQLALNYYSEIPNDAFSGDAKEELLYRKALSQLKTGFYNEAAQLFRSLVSSKNFGDPSAFYIAYIDYVNGQYQSAYEGFSKIKKTGKKGSEAEYYLNQIDYKNGDFKKVATTSERLLSTGTIPEELKAETMRVGGLSFFKLGDKVTAEKILSGYNAAAGDGAELTAIYALATIYYENGDYDKALPLFTIVTDYPGELSQSAWLYIGQIYLKQGDMSAAAMAFNKASKESWSPVVTETASYNLAVTSASGMTLPFADAAAAMESFIDTYPYSQYTSNLTSYLANAYYGRRDYVKAINILDKIASPQQKDKDLRQKILYHLGVEALRQKDLDGAIKYLSQAISSAYPDNEVAAQAAIWLGDAYYTRNNFTAATTAYERALASGKTGENTALTLYNLGYALMKLKQYSKAEKSFEKALALKTLTPSQIMDAKLRYADCLYYTGKYAQALAIFKDIKLEGGQEGVYARIREADIIGRNGKVEEKISILESLVNNPDSGIWRNTVISRLADAYSEMGNDRKAAELYAKMLESDDKSSDNSQTYYSLAANADNLYKAGDLAAAYTAYKHLETSGLSALYPSAITGIMHTSKDDSEIAEYAMKVASLPGISPEERNEALYMGAEAGLKLGGRNRQDALSALYTLARSSDREWGARAAVTLGEELLQQGETSAAEEILLNLIDSGSDNNYWLARGYITLADVYASQGKDYLARLYLETLRNSYPGDEKDINQMINSRLKTLNK